jgi:hypothetical protein
MSRIWWCLGIVFVICGVVGTIIGEPFADNALCLVLALLTAREYREETKKVKGGIVVSREDVKLLLHLCEVELGRSQCANPTIEGLRNRLNVALEEKNV